MDDECFENLQLFCRAPSDVRNVLKKTQNAHQFLTLPNTELKSAFFESYTPNPRGGGMSMYQPSQQPWHLGPPTKVSELRAHGPNSERIPCPFWRDIGFSLRSRLCALDVRWSPFVAWPPRRSRTSRHPKDRETCLHYHAPDHDGSRLQMDMPFRG